MTVLIVNFLTAYDQISALSNKKLRNNLVKRFMNKDFQYLLIKIKNFFKKLSFLCFNDQAMESLGIMALVVSFSDFSLIAYDQILDLSD